MEITSHFLGLEIKSDLFVDLFSKLQNYLLNNNIENILSFQNILSLHITLYYFDKKLPKNIKFEKNFNDEIFLDGIDYFYNNGNKKLCFLKVKNDEKLFLINKNFHKFYNLENIYENTLNYKTHITFFHIKDFDLYEIHKENIENIIKLELDKIKNNITTNKVYLYKVNSLFKPEIQIKI